MTLPINNILSQPTDIRLYFIVGATCSGKTCLARILQQGLETAGCNTQLIEVSSIIRQATKQTVRSELSGRPELDHIVINAIQKCIDQTESQHTMIIVSGCRQQTILDAFKDRAEILWVAAPTKLRQQRLTVRNDSKDDIRDLRQIDQMDKQLGVEDIISSLYLGYDSINYKE